MAKVPVTRAQVMAAKLTIEINDKLGRKTPDQIVRLANASRRQRQGSGSDSQLTPR